MDQLDFALASDLFELVLFETSCRLQYSKYSKRAFIDIEVVFIIVSVAALGRQGVLVFVPWELWEQSEFERLSFQVSVSSICFDRS